MVTSLIEDLPPPEEAERRKEEETIARNVASILYFGQSDEPVGSTPSLIMLSPHSQLGPTLYVPPLSSPDSNAYADLIADSGWRTYFHTGHGIAPGDPEVRTGGDRSRRREQQAPYI